MSRIPPHDLDAERSVIGALLVSEPAYAAVSGVVGAGDFYSETHRVIFDAVMRLHGKGEPVDQVTVSNELGDAGEFDRVGGRQYVWQIFESLPTPANAMHYANIVRDKASSRRMVDVGSRIAETFMSDPEDVRAEIDRAEQMVYGVSDGPSSGYGFSSLAETGPASLARILANHEAGGIPVGVGCGLPDVDELTNGAGEGDLVVLAARPAMGKTALALQWAYHAAEARGPAAVFSLEMSKEQLTQRLQAQRARIEVPRIKNGAIRDEEWTTLTRATNEIGLVPVHIDDAAGVSVPYMRANLRRLQSKLKARGERLSIVVVDYLQLMSSVRATDNRNQALSEITRSLKVLARDFAVPVVALSQLSRDVERRHDKRPQLSDLRDSGAIEADADAVIFLYRDEYYDEESEDRGVAEVIVGKNRNGATGKAKTAWIAKETRFASLAKGWSA